MKPVLTQLDAFLQALYRDSRLKNKIVLWTFLLLVLPGAFIAAVGISIKVVSTVMLILLLPLQFGIFSLSQGEVRKAPALEARTVALDTLDATNDAWADLVSAAIRTTVPPHQVAPCFLQSTTADEAKLRALNQFLATIAQERGTALKTLQIHQAEVETLETTLRQLLAEAQYRQSLTGRESQSSPSTKASRPEQGQPAWALTFGGQTQTAHGLT